VRGKWNWGYDLLFARKGGLLVKIGAQKRSFRLRGERFIAEGAENAEGAGVGSRSSESFETESVPRQPMKVINEQTRRHMGSTFTLGSYEPDQDRCHE